MPDERGYSEEKFLKTLRILAPGTPLREGLENVLRARTGGLIVVGDTPEVLKLCEGGFRIDADATPANLYELSKMDGAIILTSDARKIVYVNVQLVPDPTVPSFETGIRHRTAERVARQTGELVIAISQRRNIISLYRGPIKYILRDISVILNKANQAIQTLEKYKAVLDRASLNLSALEFEDLVTLVDVCSVLQRAEMVSRIVREIERYISELGTEGRLISMQLDELRTNVEEEGLAIVRDYLVPTDGLTPEQARARIAALSPEDLLDLATVAQQLGYGQNPNLDLSVSPRGVRILQRIPRLPTVVVDNLVGHFGALQRILAATIDQLDDVEGIGEVRARAIKDGLRRLRDQVLLDRHI